MPRLGAADLTREIRERLEQVSVLLLLPLFFVITGLAAGTVVSVRAGQGDRESEFTVQLAKLSPS